MGGISILCIGGGLELLTTVSKQQLSGFFVTLVTQLTDEDAHTAGNSNVVWQSFCTLLVSHDGSSWQRVPVRPAQRRWLPRSCTQGRGQVLVDPSIFGGITMAPGVLACSYHAIFNGPPMPLHVAEGWPCEGLLICPSWVRVCAQYRCATNSKVDWSNLTAYLKQHHCAAYSLWPMLLGGKLG